MIKRTFVAVLLLLASLALTAQELSGNYEQLFKEGITAFDNHTHGVGSGVLGLENVGCGGVVHISRRSELGSVCRKGNEVLTYPILMKIIAIHYLEVKAFLGVAGGNRTECVGVDNGKTGNREVYARLYLNRHHRLVTQQADGACAVSCDQTLLKLGSGVGVCCIAAPIDHHT